MSAETDNPEETALAHGCSSPAPGSASPVGAEVGDTARMDFLDQIGKPWPEEKDGKRLLLVALPYKLLDGQSAPRTIREAIDYILDCPESVERALAEVEAAGSGKETPNAGDEPQSPAPKTP